jgi:hypothetical protein
MKRRALLGLATAAILALPLIAACGDESGTPSSPTSGRHGENEPGEQEDGENEPGEQEDGENEPGEQEDGENEREGSDGSDGRGVSKCVENPGECEPGS